MPTKFMRLGLVVVQVGAENFVNLIVSCYLLLVP
jgi:hypothetical protein